MVIVVMGVSGCGKTTVGRALAERIGARFVDADDYHPDTNVAKMRSGIPLTDADRVPWLATLRTQIDRSLEAEESVVMACSALTARIREALGTDRAGVRVVHLRGARDLIERRMREREHFMPAALLDSQLALLEPPERAIEVDVLEPPETLVSAIVRAMENS
jgi:gluconokinase